MKNSTKVNVNKRYAYLILFGLVLIGSHIIVSLAIRIVQAKTHFAPGSDYALAVAGISTIGWIILPIATYIILLFLGVENKIYQYLENKDMQKIEKQRQAEEEEKRQTEEKRIEIKTAKIDYQTTGYTIKEVLSVENEALAFGVTFNEKIYSDALPIIYINDTNAPTKILSKNQVICYGSQAITTEAPLLEFAVGKNTLKIINPYLCNPKYTKPILWQNEGHVHEKKIHLPKDLFPNVNEFVAYPFQMYIGGKTHEHVEGKYNKKYDCIVIPLGNKVYKSQCVNKSCSLRASFGKGITITLPAPTILS